MKTLIYRVLVLLAFSITLSTPASPNPFKVIEKAVRDTGRAIEKGANDAGRAIEKGAHDTGRALEKGAQDSGRAIEKAAHDAGDGIDHFFLEFCKVMTGKRDAEEAKKHCNINAGYSCDTDGTCYAYDPQQPEKKYPIGRKNEPSTPNLNKFNEFVESIQPDQSKEELVFGNVTFEEVWAQGMRTMLDEWATVGNSLPGFVPPNETGLIRGPDGYASTGGSFLSLRSNPRRGVKYFHSGIDYQMNPGDEVLSGVNGVVTRVGCAYCGRGGHYENRYRTVWVKTQSGHVVRYLYVSPDVKPGLRVTAGKTRLGTAQNLELRYPPRNGKHMINHVHVQITDKKGNWISPDARFETTRNKKNIVRSGDYFEEEMLRIQGLINHLSN